MALRLFEYDKLDSCGALDGWIANPKAIEVTAKFQQLPDKTGSSGPIALKVPGWSSAASFTLTLAQAISGTLYLSAAAKYGSTSKVFLVVESTHNNKRDPTFTDPQCKHIILDAKPLEKRMMANTGWWSRKTIEGSPQSAVLAFYKAACVHLNIHLPSVPLQIVQRPQDTLAGGAA